MSGKPSSEFDWARRLRDLVINAGEGSPASEAPGGSRPPDLPRYEVRGRLGEGATAVVYRAWDRTLNRWVALKVLREVSSLSEVARERFHREARAAAGLAHPNVVAVHDAGEAEGRLYIVLELVEGRPLSRILEELPFDEKLLLEVLEKTARGVAAAHQAGVVHRDLKPANILVTDAGEPKVGDFGLAHLEEEGAALTRTGTQLGTPLYMAPEQVEGRPKDITPRTDVYALGTILYEALAGRPPFSGPTVHEIYSGIVRAAAPSPRKLNPAISRDAETIVRKAMERVPARRYPHAGALADDLRRCRLGEPIEARPLRAWTRLWRAAVRRRAAVLPVAVALALLLAWGLGAALGAARERGEAVRELERGRRLEEEGELLEAHGAYSLAFRLRPGSEEARKGVERTRAELNRSRQNVADRLRAQETALGRLRKGADPSSPRPPEPAGDVLLSESFEAYDPREWQVYGARPDSVQVVEGGVAGPRCLQLTARPGGLENGAFLYRPLPSGQDVCYLRVYVKLDPTIGDVHPEIQLLATRPPGPWPQGISSERPAGDARFTTLAALRHSVHNPALGVWWLKSSWCDMKRGGDGSYRGQVFAPRNVAIFTREKWACVEVMIRANSAPDKADGEQAIWVDGKETDRWPGLRWRTDPALKVNGICLLFAAGPGEERTSRVWFDGLVVSGSYIGPLRR